MYHNDTILSNNQLCKILLISISINVNIIRFGVIFVNYKETLWFKIVLVIMLLLYIVTIIPFIFSINGATYHLGLYAYVISGLYFATIISIIVLLIGKKIGFYMFVILQILIFLTYMIMDCNFSLEQAVLRPVVFCGLVTLGVNSKK